MSLTPKLQSNTLAGITRLERSDGGIRDFHSFLVCFFCEACITEETHIVPAQPDRTPERETRLEESGRTLGSEDLLASLLVDAVGQRELEALDKELLDVWAADVVGLLELNNLEDLQIC